MLQCICSVVDHSWWQCVVRTKKWWSAPCGLDVTISASCDWSVAIFFTSLESQESYLTLRNVTLQITRDFFHQHSTFAQLYNAAASPASRLRLAGSLAIIKILTTLVRCGRSLCTLDRVLDYRCGGGLGSHYCIIINPILIRVYPRKRGWPDLPQQQSL